MAKKNLGIQVLWSLQMQKKMKTAKLESKLILTENEDGTEEDLQTNPEDSGCRMGRIEEVFK